MRCYTYKLAEAKPAAAAQRHEMGRRQAIERLRTALWTYARGHDGRFPPADDRGAIPEEAWRVPDPSGMRYVYVAGQVADSGHAPLAYEPGLFGSGRLVLCTDGRIVLMRPDESGRHMAGERNP